MLQDTGPLLGETLVRDDSGPPRSARIPMPVGIAALWLAPTVLVLGLVLAWPILATLVASLHPGSGLPIGLGNYREALADSQFWRALFNTLAWAVVVPILVTALGYVLAVSGRSVRSHRLVTVVLVAPMALPLVVTGFSFRLVYDPSPDRGPVTAMVWAVARWFGADPQSLPPLLGPPLITPAMMSAFIWSWVGIAFLVLRAALAEIPQDLEDMVRAEGGRTWDVLRDVRWPMLRRVVTLLLVLVAVAASRTSDLILVMTPGSAQHDAEVLALYVLREHGENSSGVIAAVGMLWLLAVMAAVLAAVWSSGRLPVPPEPGGTADRGPGRDQPDPGRPWRSDMAARLLSAMVLWSAAAVWIFPVLLLGAVSLHRPVDAETRGWLAPLSLESYPELFRTLGLGDAMIGTAVLAAAVTVVVMVAAALTAYTLAWLRPTGSRITTAVLLAAAVVPIQAIAQPLQKTFAALGLGHGVVALALVHIGRGIPLAVLVLRNGFAYVPLDRIREARRQPGNDLKVLVRVALPAARPALVAIAVLEFVQVWNDLVIGLLFGGPSFTPVGLTLMGQARFFASGASVLAAGSILASLVPLVLILVFRRMIIAGLVTGVIRR